MQPPIQKEFRTIKKQVEKALKENESARNDDKYLTWLVLRNYTNIYIKFTDFNKLPSFETIRRMRQVIQNKEKRLIPTDPKVIKKRQQREKEIRKIITQI